MTTPGEIKPQFKTTRKWIAEPSRKSPHSVRRKREAQTKVKSVNFQNFFRLIEKSDGRADYRDSSSPQMHSPRSAVRRSLTASHDVLCSNRPLDLRDSMSFAQGSQSTSYQSSFAMFLVTSCFGIDKRKPQLRFLMHLYRKFAISFHLP